MTARDADLEAVGAVGGHVPRGVAAVPARDHAPARVREHTEIAHDLAARGDDLCAHRALVCTRKRTRAAFRHGALQLGEKRALSWRSSLPRP